MKNLCQIKKQFLNSQDIKTFTNQQSDKCKNKIQATGLSDCMESMKSNKTFGNDGSTRIRRNFLGWIKNRGFTRVLIELFTLKLWLLYKDKL